jgi:hypothetical protein
MVLDSWIAVLKLVVSAETCHGLRNAAIEDKIALDPSSWTRPPQLDLRARPRYDLASGQPVLGFVAKDGCAVLVAGSSGEGQQLRLRFARAGEVAAREVGEGGEPADDDEPAAAPSANLGICDACWGCKKLLLNAARYARSSPRDSVSKFAATSRLSEADRATQAAGTLRRGQDLARKRFLQAC